jgi:Tn3 transposase DDE domain
MTSGLITHQVPQVGVTELMQAPVQSRRQEGSGIGPRASFLARYPSAGPLLTRRLNSGLITGMWDDLLRVAASVKGGHATAALVVGKLCSSKRALRRRLAYAGEGALRSRHHEQQTEQMWCLTLATKPSSPGPPNTTAWPSQHCAGRAAASTTRSWPTSGPPTTKASTSKAPTPSTSVSSDTGRCHRGLGEAVSAARSTSRRLLGSFDDAFHHCG